MKLKHRRAIATREIGWSKYLRDLLNSHVRYWFNDYTNAICISCGNAEYKMIRVNTLFFCVNCFTRDFDYTLKKKGKADNKMYEKYLKKYFKENLPLCSVCGQVQISTSSGMVCKNGHGGVDSLEDE